MPMFNVPSLFSGNPVLAQASSAGPPIYDTGANPYDQSMSDGAALLRKMLAQQSAAPAYSAPAPTTAPNILQNVPALDASMFQNPYYDAQRAQTMGKMNDFLMQQATGGNVDPKTGQMTTQGKLRKYGDAAGEIVQGLGGLAAAFGPAGAAKGFNMYLENSQKQAENRRKFEADNRKEAIQSLDKLADIMGKNRKTTIDDVENILKANKAQADLQKAAAEIDASKALAAERNAGAGGQQAKNVTEIMQGIKQGATAYKETRAAGAQDALKTQRESSAGLNEQKGNTEVTKQDKNKADAGLKVSQTKLTNVKQDTEKAQQGYIGKKGNVADARANNINAKTKAMAGEKEVDTKFYKAAPPGLVDDPKINKVIAEMKKNGEWNEAMAAKLLNHAKGLPQYQKKKGGAPALTPLH